VKVTVNVYLKNGVLDPQGKAVLHALNVMGYNEVNDVRIGRQIVIECENSENIKDMCESLLANTVIEDYEIVQ
jgi:phosphoribosylformylglycinamidine synthase